MDAKEREENRKRREARSTAVREVSEKLDASIRKLSQSRSLLNHLASDASPSAKSGACGLIAEAGELQRECEEKIKAIT